MPQTLKTQVVPLRPSNRAYVGGSSSEGLPFRAFVSAVNDADQTCSVRISRFSRVMASPDLRDPVLLVGIDLKMDIAYGDKIWIETFYDTNLEPAFCVIKTGPKWTPETVVPNNTDETIPVYPKEHEFITKYDLPTKLTEIDETVLLVRDMKEDVIAELTYRKNVGVITAAQHAELVDATNTQFAAVETQITEYKRTMSQFFSGAPSAVWKKLFRTFTLIAYTTHERSLDLSSVEVSPTPVIPATAPSVPQATERVSFNVVQCLHSDIYLADMCYQNRYPAKIALPYHRGVYTYIEGSAVEEEVNTA